MREQLDIGTEQKEEVDGMAAVSRSSLSKDYKRHSVGLIPTGSTLQNLALSDNPYGGYLKGAIANLIGDKSAGKTFLSWNIFAEMNASSLFGRYGLHYDDAEQRLRIAIKKMFGKSIEDRIDRSADSDTIEDFYENLQGVFKKKKPFVYVLDSFDAVSDREELKRKGLKKDYPVKVVLLTEMLRKIKRSIRKTDSFLLIVSQVRGNIGVLIGPKKRRAGGDALGHYATYETWLSQIGHVIRKGKEVGVHVLSKTTKNSATGKLRTVEFDILHDYGVDNIGSMIDWMVKEGFWKKEKKKKGEEEEEKEGKAIETGGDFIDAPREALAKHIDENDLEDELIVIVADCWAKVEAEIKTDRKPRYK